MGRTASLSWFTLPADIDPAAESSNGHLGPLPSSVDSSVVPPPPRKSGFSARRFIVGLCALAFYALWRSPAADWAYRIPPPAKCDPFAEPGALFLNVENTSSTVWKPFDATCPPSHLLPLVEFILESDAM